MHQIKFTHMKIIIIILTLVSIPNHFHAQEESDEDADFWSHVRFGGGVGLNFGSGFFSGTLAPSALYEINNQVGIGLGLNGTYSSIKNNRNNEDFKATILGGSIFSIFNPIEALQLSIEFEELHVNRTLEFEDGDIKDRYWVPALFLGAGYRVENFTFGMRYDILYNNDKSIYANAWMPFVRVFF